MLRPRLQRWRASADATVAGGVEESSINLCFAVALRFLKSGSAEHGRWCLDCPIG